MYPSFEQSKSDIQGKFEGGVSFNIDWPSLAKEAARAVRKKISPATIKRRVPIFGGMAKDLPIYTSPSDVHTPAGLFPATALYGGRDYTYKAAAAYFRDKETGDFTIDFVNGIPFIYAELPDVGEVTTLLNVNDDTVTGVQMSSTLRSFINQTNGLEGTFDDTTYHIEWDLDTAQDFSDYQRGVVLIPFEALSDVSDIAEIKLYLYTDDTNYFTVTTTADVIGNQFIAGWNAARLDITNRAKTGTPVISNITAAGLDIVMNSGKSQKVVIDNITLHKTEAAFFEYYSNLNFKGTSGTYKDSPTEDDDVVLFTDEAYDCWQYEMCMLIVQNATYDGVDSKESTRLEGRLKDSYAAYTLKFPSMQQVQTYSIGSDIQLGS